MLSSLGVTGTDGRHYLGSCIRQNGTWWASQKEHSWHIQKHHRETMPPHACNNVVLTRRVGERRLLVPATCQATQLGAEPGLDFSSCCRHSYLHAACICGLDGFEFGRIWVA